MQKIEKIKLAESAIREQEKQIRFKIKPFRVEDLVQKYEKSQFYIPDYQREDVWSYSMKSKFIESVLLGLPIPDIFVCETKEDDEDYDTIAQYEVIDGSQRLRTLAGFVAGKFHLTKLESVKELEDFNYEDLTDFRKDKFKDVTIDIIILSSDTSEEVKNAMFDRINTSNPLKIMELRRGSHSGPFNDLVRKCGDILKNDYNKICPINRHFRDRREEEELVLRFFCLSETFNSNLVFTDANGGKISKHNVGMEEFLTQYYDYKNQVLKELEKGNKSEFDNQILKLNTDFIKMLEFVNKNFTYGFRREKSKSVARVVFEAISVGVHLALQTKPQLSDEIINTEWIRSDSTFKNSINQKYGLHEANKIIERIRIIKDKLINNG
jgi:uncharacterized protein with ParB-like and HNH nuclease domain